jgi:hypothetical protein
MSEQFAFKQSFRNGGAIHGDKGLAASIAGIVDEARQQFLARAALCLNQNIGAGTGRCASALYGAKQSRRAANDVRPAGAGSTAICFARCMTFAAIVCNWSNEMGLVR